MTNDDWGGLLCCIIAAGIFLPHVIHAWRNK
jgi:hypothetical protein